MISGIFSTSSSLSSLTENYKTLFLLLALFEQHSSAATITMGKKYHLGAKLSEITHTEWADRVPKLQEL